jgi:hypothetical protein
LPQLHLRQCPHQPPPRRLQHQWARALLFFPQLFPCRYKGRFAEHGAFKWMDLKDSEQVRFGLSGFSLFKETGLL